MLIASGAYLLACEAPHAPPAPIISDDGRGPASAPPGGASVGGANDIDEPTGNGPTSAGDGGASQSGGEALSVKMKKACEQLDPGKVYLLSEALDQQKGLYDLDDLDVPCFSPGKEPSIRRGHSISLEGELDAYAVVRAGVYRPIWTGSRWAWTNESGISPAVTLQDVGSCALGTLHLAPATDAYIVACAADRFIRSSGAQFELAMGPPIAVGQDGSTLHVASTLPFKLVHYQGTQLKGTYSLPTGHDGVIAARSEGTGFLLALSTSGQTNSPDALFFMSSLGSFEKRGVYPPTGLPVMNELGPECALAADGTLFNTTLPIVGPFDYVIRRRVDAKAPELIFQEPDRGDNPKNIPLDGEDPTRLPAKTVIRLATGP